MSKPRRLLVLEDHEDIAELMCDVALMLGIECVAAGTVAKFFELLTPEVELIVMDLSLPEMTGEQVLWRLAQEGCRARVMIVSGVGRLTLENAKRYGESLGLAMTETLTKPFRVAELMVRLRG